jgi:hypothetical protein
MLLKWKGVGEFDLEIYSAELCIYSEFTEIMEEVVNFCIDRFGSHTINLGRIGLDLTIYNFNDTNLVLNYLLNSFNMKLRIVGSFDNIEVIKTFIKEKIVE